MLKINSNICLFSMYKTAKKNVPPPEKGAGTVLSRRRDLTFRRIARGFHLPGGYLLVAHTGYDNDDDKNPKNHIKVKVTTIISFTAFSHCRLLLSMFCNIYYDYYVKFADCP